MATIGRLPASLFAPSEWSWRLAGTALVGGVPISGAPQTADVSAGGWWVCDWQVGILRTHAQHGAWRAMLGLMNSGVQLIELPVIDALKPWPVGFQGDPIDAALAADVYMPAYPAPATSPRLAQIAVAVGAALQGGEYFTVVGPSGAPRLHMVTQVTGVAGGVSTVTITPPFREDMAAGTSVDFNDPRCTVKADLESLKDAWPRLSPPFLARPKISFLEAGFVAAHGRGETIGGIARSHALGFGIARRCFHQLSQRH